MTDMYAFFCLGYLLTKVEGKVGSPETPLSDLGLISYRSYWKEALLKRLCSAPGPMLSIRNLSSDLAIASSDIVSTLQERGLMKYWKGKHIVLKKQKMRPGVPGARAAWTPPACVGGAEAAAVRPADAAPPAHLARPAPTARARTAPLSRPSTCSPRGHDLPAAEPSLPSKLGSIGYGVTDYCSYKWWIDAYTDYI
ncbi:jg5284 [Pararge aegeria aegeria]|uniref:Histone acetyltransferase n=1 Tax=Pararge aegeria aegeria TaxID=348720 RepID=A0A8S4R7E5_9NEOP|nr:jg5284 [Pararge aegeria aegeria]